MSALIQVTTNEQGLLVVSSADFAAGLEIQHKNLLETIRTHQQAIEESFGLVAFETEAVKRAGERGTKHLQSAYLTEEQALFVGTLSRNSKRVVEFKATLVRSFSEARKQLAQEVAQPAPAQLSRKELALMVVQIEEEKEALERQLELAKPKIDYVDDVLDTTDCVVTTVIANELGYSAKAFNMLLHERGIQWKVDGVWVLTAKYADKGYTQMRTHTYYDTANQRHISMSMVWTQRGRAMLHHLFKRRPVQAAA